MDADLVLTDGTVVTLADDGDEAEAEALADTQDVTLLE